MVEQAHRADVHVSVSEFGSVFDKHVSHHILVLTCMLTQKFMIFFPHLQILFSGAWSSEGKKGAGQRSKEWFQQQEQERLRKVLSVRVRHILVRCVFVCVCVWAREIEICVCLHLCLYVDACVRVCDGENVCVCVCVRER